MQIGPLCEAPPPHPTYTAGPSGKLHTSVKAMNLRIVNLFCSAFRKNPSLMPRVDAKRGVNSPPLLVRQIVDADGALDGASAVVGL